jgi:hypothetical protein
MDSLLDALITFAQQTLEKYGEFYPFAAAITSGGELQMVGGETGDERPASQEVLDTLYAGLGDQARRGEIRASGVCFDVRLRGADTDDAIQVSLEHSEGDPANVYLPYKRRRLRRLEYGELFATPGDRRVF